MKLEIPDGVLENSRWTAQELLVEFAVWVYAGDGLSLARAGQAAGLDRITFQKLLAARGIPTAYDGGEDWQRELGGVRKEGLL